jgi:hypothetical protein
VRYRNLFALLVISAWLYGSTLVHLSMQWIGPHQDRNFRAGAHDDAWIADSAVA